LANDSSFPSATRREFLVLAGLTTAGATLAQPGALFAAAMAEGPASIWIPADAHPAIHSAARILAKKLKLADSSIQTYDGAPKPVAGAIVFALASAGHLPLAEAPKRDGYTVLYTGGTVVYGARPRSLLFAAGEPEHWAAPRTSAYVRDPSFAIRLSSWHGGRPVADEVAALGVNVFTGSLRCSVTLQVLPEVFAQIPAAQQKQLIADAAARKVENAAMVKEFHDADVEIYALLPYGNNFQSWSRTLYDAALKAYPTAVGTPEPNSNEKAALCPSDPATWKVLSAFVKEWAEQAQADGISATFWDAYGMYCQDARCKQSGLDKFPNELYESITHYHAVLQPMGQKMHLRTWSSGCPHWLGTNYVNAPGYGQFGLSHPELWARVIKETPKDVLMQTKACHSDCEPDPRFSTLLGKCSPHTEIVEYQVTGQTIGRQYFPASTVDYMARTLKQSLKLVGVNGGARIDADATSQTNYDVYADIINNANLYAWRQLTWNVDADVEQMWLTWATAIYGAAPAPAIRTYMRLSEEAVYRCFSVLGHGSSTNSDFANNIARRETLLRYTNRYYLPEYAAYLEPTKENIERVAKEKASCLKHIDDMAAALELAKPHLTPAQAAELTVRLDWFRQFAICNVTLDLSLWRFRYLRGLAAKQTTDSDQMKELAEAYDLIEATTPKLFAIDPTLKFSCYDVPLGGLRRKPDLGNPRTLMHQIYTESLAFVQDSVGPDYIPASWVRAQPKMNIPANRLGQAPGV
jgi:hypothetical protein